MSEQNSLCFPCLEKVRTKFPVFPVPWPPCRLLNIPLNPHTTWTLYSIGIIHLIKQVSNNQYNGVQEKKLRDESKLHGNFLFVIPFLEFLSHCSYIANKYVLLFSLAHFFLQCHWRNRYWSENIWNCLVTLFNQSGLIHKKITQWLSCLRENYQWVSSNLITRFMNGWLGQKNFLTEISVMTINRTEPVTWGNTYRVNVWGEVECYNLDVSQWPIGTIQPQSRN